MNNTSIQNSILFIALVITQVAICNHVNFLGYINPYIYILFVAYYPIKRDTRSTFIFLSFLIGLCMDFFSDSGGIHAAASLTIAYMRPVFLRSTFGNAYDYQTLKISNAPFLQQMVYLSFMIFTHHLILFFLEILNFTHILLMLKKTLFSGIFTLILSLILFFLFKKKKSK